MALPAIERPPAGSLLLVAALRTLVLAASQATMVLILAAFLAALLAVTSQVARGSDCWANCTLASLLQLVRLEVVLSCLT